MESYSSSAKEPTPVPETSKACYNCNEAGHIAKWCPKKTERAEKPDNPNYKCPSCKAVGQHFARNCPENRCRSCSQLGHFGRDCPVVKDPNYLCRKCGAKGEHFTHHCSRSMVDTSAPGNDAVTVNRPPPPLRPFGAPPIAMHPLAPSASPTPLNAQAQPFVPGQGGLALPQAPPSNTSCHVPGMHLDTPLLNALFGINPTLSAAPVQKPDTSQPQTTLVVGEKMKEQKDKEIQSLNERIDDKNKLIGWLKNEVKRMGEKETQMETERDRAKHQYEQMKKRVEELQREQRNERDRVLSHETNAGVLSTQNKRLQELTKRYEAKIQMLQQELQTFEEKNASHGEKQATTNKTDVEELETTFISEEKPSVDQQPVQSSPKHDMVGKIHSTLNARLPHLTRQMVETELLAQRERKGRMANTTMNVIIEQIYQVLAAKIKQTSPSAPLGDRMDEGNENECAICQEEMGFKNLTQCRVCQHKYHDKCAHQWLKKQRNCPMCRSLLLSEYDYPRLQ